MISSSLLLIAQGLAFTAVPPAETGARPLDNDPNQVVCVREDRIGSRVAARRVCRTRAEWEEHRRQASQSVERAQQQGQSQCAPTPTMNC